MSQGRPILLVESDFQCAVAMSRVFRGLGLLDRLVISMDCENALIRLRSEEGPRPCLVVLDLQAPRMSAFRFLSVLKDDEMLKMIPVVAAATSNDPEQIAQCYDLGAVGYLVKSDDYSDLAEKMRAVCAYWDLSEMPLQRMW